MKDSFPLTLVFLLYLKTPKERKRYRVFTLREVRTPPFSRKHHSGWQKSTQFCKAIIRQLNK